jgi:metal-responsive CopG/Arc/MetJ family transcriptional regulator
MRTRGRKASLSITMDTELVEKLDNIEVGGTKNLARSTKISIIVERYIREYEDSLR